MASPSRHRSIPVPGKRGRPSGTRCGEHRVDADLPSYDHDHSYRVAAYAIDLEGSRDATKAHRGTFCARAGTATCHA